VFRCGGGGGGGAPQETTKLTTKTSKKQKPTPQNQQSKKNNNYTNPKKKPTQKKLKNNKKTKIQKNKQTAKHKKKHPHPPTHPHPPPPQKHQNPHPKPHQKNKNHPHTPPPKQNPKKNFTPQKSTKNNQTNQTTQKNNHNLASQFHGGTGGPVRLDHVLHLFFYLCSVYQTIVIMNPACFPLIPTKDSKFFYYLVRLPYLFTFFFFFLFPFLGSQMGLNTLSRCLPFADISVAVSQVKTCDRKLSSLFILTGCEISVLCVAFVTFLARTPRNRFSSVKERPRGQVLLVVYEQMPHKIDGSFPPQNLLAACSFCGVFRGRPFRFPSFPLSLLVIHFLSVQPPTKTP